MSLDPRIDDLFKRIRALEEKVDYLLGLLVNTVPAEKKEKDPKVIRDLRDKVLEPTDRR